MTIDPFADAMLFDMVAPPPVALSDRFGVPPFSVLDRRSGDWKSRKRKWLSMGIKSELGRDDFLLSPANRDAQTFIIRKMREEGGVTSIFDPVLCELMYRWFSDVGDRVLDPFAGGSVRGVVASTLQREYTGIDLRDEQVFANREQQDLGQGPRPRWIVGDATEARSLVDGSFDLIFSCPPYADLERYSDDPRDLSTMTYEQFTWAHRTAIKEAVNLLRPDRFAVWVISDVRDKSTGNYRGLVADTIKAFEDAGVGLYNDAVLLDPVGTIRLRAGFAFNASRKLGRMHQHVLVFVKGDGKRAAKRLTPIDPALLLLPDDEEPEVIPDLPDATRD